MLSIPGHEHRGSFSQGSDILNFAGDGVADGCSCLVAAA